MNSNSIDEINSNKKKVNYINKIIKSEDFSFDYYSNQTANDNECKINYEFNQLYDPYATINSSDYNFSKNKLEDSGAPDNNLKDIVNTHSDKKSHEQSIDEIFKIAKKAEELLRELNKPSDYKINEPKKQGDEIIPLAQGSTVTDNNYNYNINQLTITQQPSKLDLNNVLSNYKKNSVIEIQNQVNFPKSYFLSQNHIQYQCLQLKNSIPNYPVTIPLPHQVDASFFATNPPPTISTPMLPLIISNQNQYSYPFNNKNNINASPTQQLYYHTGFQNYSNQNSHFSLQPQQQQRFPLKRKFNDQRYRSYSNDVLSYQSPKSDITQTKYISNSSISSNNKPFVVTNDNEDDDLNIVRERELKDLKCKSVVEKMNVFLKYFQQFKDLYQQRLETIECSDSLKIQFHSMIKYLIEYEQILLELNLIIKEHEYDNICKNNHRKTKKLFNKTKAFIRYESYKRLQSNIFEYRRQINSQDRFAGMYDILDMNNFLIGLLPDIGVSIRRYINKCEKAKKIENELENTKINIDDFTSLNDDSEFSNSSLINNDANENVFQNNIDIHNSINVDDTVPYTQINGDLPRSYESFSKGIDSLNRYLLKRVENEESLDELVKERIIKWINKRQSKYILIFSDVDKLLNQHKDGECYSKFHSFLLFNLGKLVTVCDSYHQKLKELLYSTTIRRKKKRKKVKIVPESMSDVFTEINELKRALEHTKFIIKKCNEIKTFPLL